MTYTCPYSNIYFTSNNTRYVFFLKKNRLICICNIITVTLHIFRCVHLVSLKKRPTLWLSWGHLEVTNLHPKKSSSEHSDWIPTNWSFCAKGSLSKETVAQLGVMNFLLLSPGSKEITKTLSLDQNVSFKWQGTDVQC